MEHLTVIQNKFALAFRALKIDRDFSLIVLSIISLIGLLFFPRLLLGSGAKIRLEDIVYFLLLFILLFRILIGRFAIYKEFVLPFIYFLYPFMISLARAVGGMEWGFWFIVFWAKEFQYFILFIVFCYLAAANKMKYIFGAIILLIVLNDMVGLYKIIKGINDYYGIGAAFIEKDAPSIAGQVYLGCALFASLMWYLKVVQKKYLKVIMFALFVISAVCCLATGSKSNGFGIIIFIVSFFVFHDIFALPGKKMLIRKIVKWGAVIGITGIITSLVIYQWDFKVFNRINLVRLRNPIESTSARYKYDLMPKLRKIDGLFDYITGVGYMAGQTNNFQVHFTSAYDNQFIRNVLVLGIIGSIIWLIMLGKFGWDFRGSPRMFVFYCTMLVSYLAMGNGIESFGASKSGPFFWIITGILIGFNLKEKSTVKRDA